MQQCPKSLWLQVYRPELRSSSDKREHIFESGNQVGFLAQQLFPAGTDVSELTKMNLNKAIEVTSKLISKNAAVIYEATFQYNGVLVMVDILVKTAQGYSIYEVKSGTSVKDANKTDAAVQYHVLSKCAIPIDKVFVTTLNREYVRKGALNPLDLFIHHDVTDDVIGLQSQVVHLIEDAKSTLTQTEQPTIEIGQHCNKPYECEFKDYCWADHRAADSILTLRYGGDAMWEWFYQGIHRLGQIPENAALSHKQRIQRRAALGNELHVDASALSEFLSHLKYPLSHLDFETIGPALPIFDHTRPYEPIPFQYSIHREHTDGDLEHFEYLHPADGGDPREALALSMLEVLGTEGSILVYHQVFEEGRIRDLAAHLPHLSTDLLALIPRIIDLEKPFSDFHIYHPNMQGKSSIKYVLPALYPNMRYDQLVIQDGDMASQTYLRMLKNESDNTEGNRKALLEYCKLDTEAMVKTLTFLRAQCA